MARQTSGWIVFTSIALGLAGVMRIFDAIWAFRSRGVLPISWIPYYPVWSIVYIVIGGLVIQALVVHGEAHEPTAPKQPAPPSRVAVRVGPVPSARGLICHTRQAGSGSRVLPRVLPRVVPTNS